MFVAKMKNLIEPVIVAHASETPGMVVVDVVGEYVNKDYRNYMDVPISFLENALNKAKNCINDAEPFIDVEYRENEDPLGYGDKMRIVGGFGGTYPYEMEIHSSTSGRGIEFGFNTAKELCELLENLVNASEQPFDDSKRPTW